MLAGAQLGVFVCLLVYPASLTYGFSLAACNWDNGWSWPVQMVSLHRDSSTQSCQEWDLEICMLFKRTFS